MFLSTSLCGWAYVFSDHTGYLREMKWEEWVPSFLVDRHLIEELGTPATPTAISDRMIKSHRCIFTTSSFSSVGSFSVGCSSLALHRLH